MCAINIVKLGASYNTPIDLQTYYNHAHPEKFTRLRTTGFWAARPRIYRLVTSSSSTLTPTLNQKPKNRYSETPQLIFLQYHLLEGFTWVYHASTWIKNDVEDTKIGFKESLTPKVAEGKEKILASLKPATFKGTQRNKKHIETIQWFPSNCSCKLEISIFTTLDPKSNPCWLISKLTVWMVKLSGLLRQNPP